MNKKTLLSTLMASSFLLSAGVSATDQTGTANFNLIVPIVVTEATAMDFGDIAIADGQCVLTESNSVSGSSCVPGGNAAQSGVFNITGADATVNVALSAADSSSVPGVTFTPQITANTVDITSGTASINVGGTIDVVAANTTAGVKAISYTVSVTY